MSAGYEVTKQVQKSTTTSTRKTTDITETPVGVQYNAKQRDYQLFPEEYFTSTDCQVYFNDVYIEDLTGLSFALSESVNPIFGYGSQTWDYFSRGRRTVVGQFRMAFREAGYLYGLMDHFGQKNGQTATHMSWLMNDDERNIYNGYNGAPSKTFGQLMETLEDIFQRNHADKDAKEDDKTATKEVVVGFDWDLSTPIKKGDTNATRKNNSDKPYKGQVGVISQLQQWLLDNGYKFSSHPLNWNPRYGYYASDTWYKDNSWTQGANGQTNKGSKKIAINVPNSVFDLAPFKGKINRGSGSDWYMLMRYRDNTGGNGYNSAWISQIAGHSEYEYQLQVALSRYPGKLDGLYMGAANYNLSFDGRYGPNTKKGVNLLIELAEIKDGSNGYWISSKTKKAIEEGFDKVTGTYDFGTKVAVYIFQDTMKKAGKLSGSQYPNGIVDEATMKLMTWKETVEYTVEGASLYQPEEAYESRMAIYEREIWGRSFYDDAEAVRSTESFFYRGRTFDDGRLYTAPLYQKGFDIYINYGPISQFYLSKNYEVGDEVSFNTTVKAIRNVQIYNVEQVLDPNTGQCIEEIYSFYSKDLD